MSAAAGHTEESILGVPTDSFTRGANVVLRVRGHLLAADHLLDGDYLVVNTRAPGEGDPVVAIVGALAYVGRYFVEESGSIRLEPISPGREPQVFEADEVEIRAVILSVIRKF